MTISRFWWSVWSVVKYLAGVGLLAIVVSSLVTLLGLMPLAVQVVVVGPAVALACLAGTFLYADWQWGWKADNMGLRLNAGAIAGGLAAGIGAGVAAALVADLVGGFSAAQSLIPAVPAMGGLQLYQLALLLLTSFAVELIFRGAVVSRYQYDLSRWELLAAATLTPFGWIIVSNLLRFGQPAPGIASTWEAAMSVALTLLFLRFDSVWLTAGLRFGMLGAVSVLGLQGAGLENGALMVWGGVAVVLLAMEWFKQQGQPKRMQPNRGRVVRGRTQRGPWGPH